jgi:UDP-glucose 4-epimerase
MTRTILVTGGAGHVGSALGRRLVENDDNYVVIVDNLLTGSRENLPSAAKKNWKFIRADVNKWADLAPPFSLFRFDYVFHYAAVVGVQRTLANPHMVLNDIDGIRNVLDLAKSTGVSRVLFSSSSEVYGEPVETPQREHVTPLNSKLPYAVVKNLSEAFLRTYQSEFGLNYTIFRFFNTYGPSQSEDFVISRFLRQALRNEDLVIYGDGLQTRTFCHISDNLDATLAALDDDRCINEVINVGSEIEMTILELANTVVDITGTSARIRHVSPLKEGDMTRRKPDITVMKRLLGRDPIPLPEGLRRILSAWGATAVSAKAGSRLAESAP